MRNLYKSLCIYIYIQHYSKIFCNYRIQIIIFTLKKSIYIHNLNNRKYLNR